MRQNRACCGSFRGCWAGRRLRRATACGGSRRLFAPFVRASRARCAILRTCGKKRRHKWVKMLQFCASVLYGYAQTPHHRFSELQVVVGKMVYLADNVDDFGLDGLRERGVGACH